MKDIRPLLTSLKEIDKEDIPRAWEIYKENIRNQARSKDLALVAPKAQSSFFSTIANTFQAIAGVGTGGLATARPSNSSIDRIETYCAGIRKALDRELINHAKNVEKYRKEQDEMIEKQIEEIKKSDLKLIDYLMGNAPQPGAPPKEEE